MYKLRAKLPEVTGEFFELTKKAEEARERETAAAVKIQKAVRGFLVRRRIDRLSLDVVLVIQRYWRGYLGRLRAKLALELHNKQLRQAYFDAKATVIQRHWRGFWSRKALFDFYARRRYLSAVRAKNEATRAEMNEEAERAAQLQRQNAQETARRMFDERIGKLHHLLSTATQPGIFNSPYAVATGTQPVVAGLPVEEHLKEGFKAQVSQKLPPIVQKRGTGSPGLRSTNGSSGGATATGSPKREPYPGELLFQGQKLAPRITLRQMMPYDTVHQAELLEEKIHRAEMLQLHPQPFGHTHLPDAPMMGVQSNRNVLPYVTPYDPTVGTRNERFSQAMQKISNTQFGRHTKKVPFFDKTLNPTDGY